MRQNLNLVLDLQNEIPDVNGNSWKFEQVLLNLFSNSAHAILEIKKYKPNNFKERFIIKTFSNDTHIVVTVDDNGIGVVQKFKNIMFYPFATSKKPGEGSGLGLSIVYNVVREMSGRLDFKSTPFVGTTIVLIFPYLRQNKDRL
jgi:signal transduction histidine kinase